MSHGQMLRWVAFYLDEATKQDPEVTQWDDDDTKQRKLQRANR